VSIQLAWGSRVSEDFAQALIELCQRFGWTASHASWLMACMAFESARTFRSDIRNAAGSGAVGLIQFMPSTAAGLGTSVENLALLSPESQLYYVGEYFRSYAARIASLPDMYMAILLPSAIGKPDDAPLFVGGVAYRQNSGLDANDDGTVTKAEASSRVQAMLTEGLQPPNVATYAWSA
jgi:hypothetical protein